MAEARRFWEMVAEKASLTKIQAGYLITAVYNLNGLDKLVGAVPFSQSPWQSSWSPFTITPTKTGDLEMRRRSRAGICLAGNGMSVMAVPYRNKVDELTTYFVTTISVHHTLSIPQPVCCQTPTRIQNGILRYGSDNLPIQRCTRCMSGIVSRQHARYI